MALGTVSVGAIAFGLAGAAEASQGEAVAQGSRKLTVVNYFGFVLGVWDLLECPPRPTCNGCAT